MPARHFFPLILLVFAFPKSGHTARVLEHYDLKQLCEMAGLVVQAEIIDAAHVKTLDGDCAVWNVKILSTLNREAQPQPVIRVAGIEEYHKGPGIEGVIQGYPRLAKGEVVYLFLASKGTPGGYAKYDLTNADWKVIESGVRLVVDGKVYDFGQYFPPGPSAGPVPGFVAMTGKTFPRAPILSVQAFEKQVRESIHASSKKTLRP